MDEVAVVRLELEGTVYAIKGAGYLLGKGAQVVSSLVKHATSNKRPGGMSFSSLEKVSESTPVAFEVPMRTSQSRFVIKDANGDNLSPRTYNELSESERFLLDGILNEEKTAFKEGVDVKKSSYKADGKTIGEKLSAEVETLHVTIIPSEFEEDMLVNGIHYCALPDMKPTDNYYPFAVASQDATNAAILVKRTHARENQRMEMERDRHLELARSERELADSLPKEKSDERIIHLKNADIHEDIAKAYGASLEDLSEKSKDPLALEEIFLDNKEVLANPDKAIKDAANGVLVERVSVNEAFLPIRIVDNIPANGQLLYKNLNNDTIIERHFIANSGNPYSLYKVIGSDGIPMATFTDKGLSDSEWKIHELPKMINLSGFNEEDILIKGSDFKAIEEYEKTFQDTPVKLSKEAEEISKEAISQQKKEENLNRSALSLESDSIIGKDTNILMVKTPEGDGFITFDSKKASLSKDGKTLFFDKDTEFVFTNAITKERSLLKGVEIEYMLKNTETMVPNLSVALKRGR